VLTPIVAAQCDGVHFVIENRTGSTFYFVPVHVDDEAVDYGEFASHGDNSIPPGTKDLIFVLPPGRRGAFAGQRERHSGPDLARAGSACATPTRQRRWTRAEGQRRSPRLRDEAPHVAGDL
jgi:hypothetical protein